MGRIWQAQLHRGRWATAHHWAKPKSVERGETGRLRLGLGKRGSRRWARRSRRLGRAGEAEAGASSSCSMQKQRKKARRRRNLADGGERRWVSGGAGKAGTVPIWEDPRRTSGSWWWLEHRAAMELHVPLCSLRERGSREMRGRERKSKGKEGTEEKGGEAGLLLESDGGGVPPTRRRGRAALGRGAQLLRTRSGRGSRR